MIWTIVRDFFLWWIPLTSLPAMPICMPPKLATLSAGRDDDARSSFGVRGWQLEGPPPVPLLSLSHIRGKLLLPPNIIEPPFTWCSSSQTTKANLHWRVQWLGPGCLYLCETRRPAGSSKNDSMSGLELPHKNLRLLWRKLLFSHPYICCLLHCRTITDLCVNINKVYNKDKKLLNYYTHWLLSQFMLDCTLPCATEMNKYWYPCIFSLYIQYIPIAAACSPFTVHVTL